MAREANTPLILWICAAVCAHYLFADAGGEVARTHEDHSFMAGLGARVRARVRSEEQTFEVATVDAIKPGEEPPKPPEEEPKPPEPKKEPPKPEAKKDETKALEPPPPAQKDTRIAVRQHVQPNQEDNKTARFIGDQANKVEEETVATMTSHDQDDPNPTPAGNHAGDQKHVGDSDLTKIAESEEHKGDRRNAPGEKGTEFEVQREPMPTKPMGPVAVVGPAAAQPQAGGDGHPPQTSLTPPDPTPTGAAPTTPEVQSGSEGTWSLNPVLPNAGSADVANAADGSRPRQPSVTNWLGLGGRAGPGQANLNLNQMGAVAVVGQDQLRKEREADGERRRSEHRGSWTSSNFERWRSAIENYVSSVKPGNQTSLNTAQVPFASYLNGMHNRIHPLFADSFLGSLESLPPTHPLNNKKLMTSLEIVVSKDGHLIKMGVVKTSGITAFDIAALDAVNRAQPFGPAPAAIVSPDGKVYLHWEFHRDEVYACSTMNARPFLLKAGATPPDPAAPTPPPTAPVVPTQEHGLPTPANVTETREGRNEHAPLPLLTGARES